MNKFIAVFTLITLFTAVTFSATEKDDNKDTIEQVDDLTEQLGKFGDNAAEFVKALPQTRAGQWAKCNPAATGVLAAFGSCLPFKKLRFVAVRNALISLPIYAMLKMWAWVDLQQAVKEAEKKQAQEEDPAVLLAAQGEDLVKRAAQFTSQKAATKAKLKELNK